MNRQPYEKPPRWWPPRLSPWWIRFWNPLTTREQRKRHRLERINLVGLEHVRDALSCGHGVLITPNHSSHADCFTLYAMTRQLGMPCYTMVAWQVFQRSHWLRRLALQHYGCFSIDREGTDLHALRQAVEVLTNALYPLVVFPEGEVYHCNERIRPFREGPAAMALLAARKGNRPVVCVPCGIRYHYASDPMPHLLALMDKLEERIYWRPRPDLPLSERIYRFAEGALALKEVEYIGHTCSGPLPQRIADFVDVVLSRLESRHHLVHPEATVPERVKVLRQHMIQHMEALPTNDPARREYEEGLDDLFFVVQLFSYPGNYVSDRPSIERIAETLDKFEEDVLQVKTATIRGSRRATVTFGAPIRVVADRGKDAAANLTRLLEDRVQSLLDAAEQTASPHSQQAGSSGR